VTPTPELVPVWRPERLLARAAAARAGARDAALTIGPPGAPLFEVGTAAGAARAVTTVRLYDGQALAESRPVAAEVEVLRSVVVAARQTKRGDEVAADAIALEERWISPAGATPLTAIADAAGAEARTLLNESAVIRHGDVQPAVLVKRGQIVDVLCLSGGLEIKSRARAQREGRKGEMIELRTEGSRKDFTARVDGPARVVMQLDGEPAPEPAP
jgi:flagella basal body P-ring formation protein FlgA